MPGYIVLIVVVVFGVAGLSLHALGKNTQEKPDEECTGDCAGCKGCKTKFYQ